MARYTGPKVRISRRLGVNVFENTKGSKALERRPFPPGHHGRSRRKGAGSEYLAQMQEKQKAKFIYGLLERQFRNLYKRSVRLTGPTGENLLRPSPSCALTTWFTVQVGQRLVRKRDNL